jgi:hypothetical protein
MNKKKIIIKNYLKIYGLALEPSPDSTICLLLIYAATLNDG